MRSAASPPLSRDMPQSSRQDCPIILAKAVDHHDAFGGFGLQFLSSVADAAFMAAWSHSIEELPIRFPSLWSTDQSPFAVPSIQSALHLAISSFHHLLGNSAEKSTVQSVSDLFPSKDKFQLRLKSESDAAILDHLMSEAADNRELSSLRCRPLAGGCAHLKDARTETLRFLLSGILEAGSASILPGLHLNVRMRQDD